MPLKTVMVGSLSMRKFIGMISDILSASGTSPVSMPDSALFSSWYSYIALDARGLAPGLEAGFLIPAFDIGALVKSGSALFKGVTTTGKGI